MISLKATIGTRGSKLALYQAELVKDKILQAVPMAYVKIKVIKTSGDMIRNKHIAPLETKRVYTREIEEALLQKDVDIAVHSAKDMAANLPEGTQIGAVLEREDARDCLVSRDGHKLAELPLGARIGTSALRRVKQLQRLRPEIIVEPVRGNVDSRIRKMEEGHYDAIVLAHAGMKRLGLSNLVSEVFSSKLFYPAPAQGVIVAQTRAQDTQILELIQSIHHRESGIELECERGFLKQLQGGCQLPCGMRTQLEDGELRVSGILFDLEEKKWVEARAHGSADKPEKIGRQLADEILRAGGDEILERIRKHEEEK